MWEVVRCNYITWRRLTSVVIVLIYFMEKSKVEQLSGTEKNDVLSKYTFQSTHVIIGNEYVYIIHS